MKQFDSTVISNEPLGSDLFEMKFTWVPEAGIPEPGRFFTVRTSESSVPLLRRPFAFSAFNPADMTAAMLYQKRGPGTGILVVKVKNDKINIIGPLGKPFPLPQKKRKALLVAGGIGIGPILFLAAALDREKIDRTLVFGCRTAANVPQSDSFSAARPQVCTDDGSLAFKGTATDYLSTLAGTIDASTVLFACGPHPMLKGCHAFARDKGLRCLVSVEQIMACGVGACMGCAVRVNREPGFARACVEGPVFDSNEINWDA